MPSSSPTHTSYISSDYLICFIGSFRAAEADLESFRSELDAYCAQIPRHLLSHALDKSISADVSSILSAWYSANIEALTRFVKDFSIALPSILFSILLGLPVDLVGAAHTQQADFHMLQKAINISSLWPVPDTSLSSIFSRDRSLHIINMSSVGNEVQTPLKVPQFCIDWAREMTAACPSPVAVKAVIQTHVLIIVKEINIMQRLLGMAEQHHYALFNAFQFLQTCSTVPSVILASCLVAKDEGESSMHAQVVKVMQEFIVDRYGPNWLFDL